MSVEQAWDGDHFRSVLGHFATGITVITAIAPDGPPVGFTCQSFSSLSLDPPLVMFSPAGTSSSWPKIRAAGHFCANVLAADQKDVCATFARSGADKFASVGWRPSPKTGAPILDDVLAWVDAEIESETEAGDHVIVVGRVVDLAIERDTHPLLFYRGGYGLFSPHE